ncbi:hypothetical protein G3I59_30000 [Amycolatopsis rubida]|uniref:Excreted virulence factor EspC, type VII ESX diderm n=1 Tax=Amycolatopsis rubida TaxID=112413 RepID=A0ABX0BWD5_9PSEU|nr:MULTISPECIES: hypothetical protein [Amycolatopsis]MYW94714.1 hypothetical protein [Amycolatopsis rubida]NEC59701.1 hypothetical protein [Amycolatopsis rubida]OAP24548.1 hypothetical protein A4R44_04514 [Amycolatopsis sp. M39]
MTFKTNTTTLQDYGTGLGHYKDEAGKFGTLISTADVGDKSWGLIGLVAKQMYTSKLGDLRQLLEAMKAGTDALTEKMGKASEIYAGQEKEVVDALEKIGKAIDSENGTGDRG